MSLGNYDHGEIEKKWQDVWLKNNLYTPDIKKAKKPFYNLWMWPYPSAEGLHVGHAFASTGSDIYGRFMRMHGSDVFQPIGYDSFGIHSENYAIKVGEQPRVMLKRTTKHYGEQLKSLGHGYDWTRTVAASDVDYYRWTQWLFVRLFKAGLAYKKKAPVNWCSSCRTVLADEQVINGECERCQTEVEKKELEQWFFKITDYADRLLDNQVKIDWSNTVKTAQTNWIGRSEGMIIDFEVEGDKEILSVFTTRPDTLDSATFVAVSSKDLASQEASKEKLGKFTGEYTVNPANGNRLPIWETNYVESGYGTGAIMGVPAYDERDMEFAKKYDIDIVTEPLDKDLWKKIEKQGWGRKAKQYHLKDWLVSRQRYWGSPIPMIWCKKCGWQAVKEEDLPVKLPDIDDYKPSGKGEGPLANHPGFYKTVCPKCGETARRETDVMDTFVDSSWYHLRYPSLGSESAGKLPFDRVLTKKWLPVNLYFGGAEHSVLHLMYARFVGMFLFDRGLVDFEEPYPRFFAHGLMIKDGAKMSKSRGNVVNPDEYIAKFGADTLRLYLMFLGPMDASPDFRDAGIEGMRRFTARLWKLFSEGKDLAEKDKREVYIKLHKTIQKVTEDIENFKYNTAIAAVMELVNLLEIKGSDDGVRENLILILAPFVPHMAEEIWQDMKGKTKKFESIHLRLWPKWDPELVKAEKVTVIVQVNGKLRATLTLDVESSKQEDKVLKLAKEDKKMEKWLKGGRIKKEIFVSGRLVNFVI